MVTIHHKISKCHDLKNKTATELLRHNNSDYVHNRVKPCEEAASSDFGKSTYGLRPFISGLNEMIDASSSLHTSPTTSELSASSAHEATALKNGIHITSVTCAVVIDTLTEQCITFQSVDTTDT